MNGLQCKSVQFHCTKIAAKNSIFVQITHVQRLSKAERTQNHKKILQAIHSMRVSVQVAETVQNG